jgi:hypothetical protein
VLDRGRRQSGTGQIALGAPRYVVTDPAWVAGASEWSVRGLVRVVVCCGQGGYERVAAPGVLTAGPGRWNGGLDGRAA